jgi:hypothetical protein
MLAAVYLFILHLFLEIISEPFRKSQQQSNYMLKPTLQQVTWSPSGDSAGKVYTDGRI